MIKIYGCSDDLVEIYGSVYKEDEIDAEIKSHSVIKQKYPDRP